MSRTSRNFIIAYILLVGLPLAGLVGILRSGRSLHAPISIDGNWKIEADTSRLGSAPCSQALSSLADSPLVISQSGKTFVLAFNNGPKTTASGFLEGKNLTAPVTLESARGSGCMAAQPLTLVATVDPQSEPKSLSGSLSVNDCPSCAALEFRAFKMARPKKEGAH
jgi:hypothetical protein